MWLQSFLVSQYFKGNISAPTHPTHEGGGGGSAGAGGICYSHVCYHQSAHLELLFNST